MGGRVHGPEPIRARAFPGVRSAELEVSQTADSVCRCWHFLQSTLGVYGEYMDSVGMQQLRYKSTIERQKNACNT
ncbi:hypothetical protein RvY_01105 [Ramazzottius varieornatus]|uniref:Uncharacterized protein n=1 Tax=Ramazzottius varieornatus TaxID=947166 RepID=A0A1D1UMA7_RAMVA|nr:hypothetical protein RvY_01105 [Ramazzottius varieornatus]